MLIDKPTCTLYFATAEPAWHDGPGWYYIEDEYPEEGSTGAFKTWEEAANHAEECGYVRPTPSGVMLADEAGFCPQPETD